MGCGGGPVSLPEGHFRRLFRRAAKRARALAAAGDLPQWSCEDWQVGEVANFDSNGCGGSGKVVAIKRVNGRTYLVLSGKPWDNWRIAWPVECCWKPGPPLPFRVGPDRVDALNVDKRQRLK